MEAELLIAPGHGKKAAWFGRSERAGLLELLKPYLQAQIRDDTLGTKGNERTVLADDVLSAEVEVKAPMERYVVLLPEHRQRRGGEQGGSRQTWSGLRHGSFQLRIKLKPMVTKAEEMAAAAAASASAAAAAAASSTTSMSAAHDGNKASVANPPAETHADVPWTNQEPATLAEAAAPAVAAVVRANTLANEATDSNVVADHPVAAPKRLADTATHRPAETNKRARTAAPDAANEGAALTRRLGSSTASMIMPTAATAGAGAAEIEVITIDDDDDVDPEEVVEQVTDMSRISIEALRLLIKAVEPELWQIFKGKCHSTRHDQYRKKGKARAALKHQVKFGEMTEQQQEFILATLTDTFCKKGEKYMRYVMDVLFPECLIRMVIMSMSSINTQNEAEAYLASGGAGGGSRR